MPTDFFNRLLQSLENTSMRYFAKTTLERHCKEISRNPNNLRPRDGAALIARLMCNISDLLPEDEWRVLDEKLKRLVSDGEGSPVQGKVKGEFLESVMTSIQKKWGKETISAVRKAQDIPEKFKIEVWYPLEILTSILDDLDRIYESDYKRSGQLGSHVINNYLKSGGERIFGSLETSLADSLMNLCEFLYLNGLKVNPVDQGVALQFSGVMNENFNQFLAGMCEAEVKLRNLPATISITKSGSSGLSEIVLKPITGGGTDAI